MGGDFGPSVIVPAALQAVREHSDLSVYLVGSSEILKPYLQKLSVQEDSRVHIIHAPEVIAMDEKPLKALRSKPQSSMRLSLELVRDGKAKACISAGNTGALMALATVLIGTLPGIERPAIVAELPNQKGGETYMLDLGANIEASAEQLTSFAIMGSVLAEAEIANPKVVLLNIGEEAIKGRDSIKLASEILLNQSELNYQGYIEANHIYTGEADVIVCDGFTGNNVLKASEGITRYLYEQLKDEFSRNWRSRMIAALVKPVLLAFKKRINPDHFNGASLLGLQEIVIKSHGSADEVATRFAINKAIKEIERQVPQKIQVKVARLVMNQEVDV